MKFSSDMTQVSNNEFTSIINRIKAGNYTVYDNNSYTECLGMALNRLSKGHGAEQVKKYKEQRIHIEAKVVELSYKLAELVSNSKKSRDVDFRRRDDEAGICALYY